MRLLTALPTPVFGLLLGREWLAEPTLGPDAPTSSHYLDT
jgi:hypothetical protein